ncbi:MAG: hypothetical protein JST68_12800 [Bacteroidetes bacterium]|nr:hypothetical protein [Bacteroidota bacterium]
MNNHFNLNRWWMLVTLHWVENRRRYVLSLLAIAGAMIAIIGFIFANDRHRPMSQNYQFGLYYTGLCLIGCFYGSLIFAELGRKREATLYLSLPASQLEKLLCGLFYGVIGFFVAYSLLFYLLDLPATKIADHLIIKYYWKPRNTPRPEPVGIYNILTSSDEYRVKDTIAALVIYQVLQSTYILGSIYFSRYSFVKTTLAMLVLFLLGFLFLTNLPRALPANFDLDNLFRWRRHSGNPPEHEWVLFPAWLENLLTGIITYSLPLLFWFVSLVRLKEKEVQG